MKVELTKTGTLGRVVARAMNPPTALGFPYASQP
jgi:hypothetical protein